MGMMGLNLSFSLVLLGWPSVKTFSSVMGAYNTECSFSVYTEGSVLPTRKNAPVRPFRSQVLANKRGKL